MLFSWAAWRPPLLEGADRKRDVPDLCPTCRDKLECITCVFPVDSLFLLCLDSHFRAVLLPSFYRLYFEINCLVGVCDQWGRRLMVVCGRFA